MRGVLCHSCNKIEVVDFLSGPSEENIFAHFDFAFVVVVVVTVKHWRHDSARGLSSQQVFFAFSFGDCMRGLKKFIFFQGRAPTPLNSGIYRALSL